MFVDVAYIQAITSSFRADNSQHWPAIIAAKDASRLKLTATRLVYCLLASASAQSFRDVASANRGPVFTTTIMAKQKKNVY